MRCTTSLNAENIFLGYLLTFNIQYKNIFMALTGVKIRQCLVQERQLKLLTGIIPVYIDMAYHFL